MVRSGTGVIRPAVNDIKRREKRKNNEQGDLDPFHHPLAVKFRHSNTS